MNQKQLISGLAGVVIGLLVSPIIMPYVRQGGPMMGRSPSEGIRRSGSMMQDGVMGGGMMGDARDMDRHFIERMIPHHEDAIEMAEEAVAKAEHTELRSLAGDIMTAQQSEIDAMRKWYADWYGEEPAEIGASVETMMHMGIQGRNVQKPAAGSYSFDLDFIETMIPHHQMAVMMAQMLLVSTEHPEMKELAENIISSQSKEIETMRAWRSAWAK